MSSVSPARKERRLFSRKQRVVESSDEDDTENRPPCDAKDQDAQNSDESTLTTKHLQKSTRRSRGSGSSAKPLPLRTKKSFMASDSADALNEIPTSHSSNTAQKSTNRMPRKSVRTTRKSALTATSMVDQPEPRNEITLSAGSAEPSAGGPQAKNDKFGVPLADITDKSSNAKSVADHTATPAVTKPEMPSYPYEKPMDIVVRTRAKGIPGPQDLPESKTRLVITYLILNNFKSYAGRQEVGPFHASFSSVVGPNGSGKSNVIDSLLFVFGFRASKMRQGKISSLIHNSARHPALDSCEVQVHFQRVVDHPGGAKEVIPDSNLVVSRKAFKNNSSRYYVDGRESNFTEVTTMLRDYGIDLDHKRFLILQGEVESIAQMKPKAASEHDDGLLEYLEDIIGTSKFKTPIEESSAETETFNELCREKQGRVQHVEKERNALESKKNAAVAHIQDENELANKQSALWQIFVHECEDNVQVTGEAVEQIQQRLNAELEKHQDAEDEITRLGKQHADEVKQCERLQQNTQAIFKQLAKADKENVKFEEKRNHVASRLKKLQKTKNASESAVREASSNLQRLEDDLQRNNASLAGLEQEMSVEEVNLTSVRESLRGKTEVFSNQIEAKQKQLSPWHEQIQQKQAAMDVARSELDILLERDNAGSQAICELQNRLTHLRESKNAKAASLADATAQSAAMEKEVHGLATQLEKLTAQEPDLRSSVSTARQRADEAKASLKSSQSRGNVLDGLMRLKDSGRVTGFHGRLGNLGTIDQKYDVAISTACPQLENLVVDSVEVGQQCIDFLRKNNLGRANFILLDRQSNREISPIQTPENVPRLIDLLRSKEEKFLPAFYSVLQDTLVAEDLAQANRVAYGAKRWRVVTVDGQLIDKSGTMSGGGARVAKGAMSSKLVVDTSKEQVAKLEGDQEMHEQNFAGFQQQKQDLEQTLKDKQDAIPKLETQIQKMALETESINRNIGDAEKRLAELLSSSQPTKSDGRTTILQKDMQTLQNEIASLVENTTGIEGEIRDLQEKIMDVGGVKLRGQKAQVDSLKDQIKNLQEQIAGAEVDLARETKLKAKHEKSSNDAEADIATVEKEVEQLSDEEQRQTNDLGASRKEADEAQEALESKREVMEALKNELDERTVGLRQSRGEEIEMRNQLEENQKVLQENKKRLRYWEEKLEKLLIQVINESNASIEEQKPSTQTRDELADLDKTVLKGEIAILEERSQNAQIEVGVLAEYRRRSEEHAARSSDLAEAVNQRDAAKKRCEELRRLRLEGFMEGFSIISLRLKEMYQMITMGGNAELELVDSLDPFSEGILFSVMPPKKSWKNISNLSGGEKTLSSLALVFALHHYKPTPLYVMDEIDAALDFRNVSKGPGPSRVFASPKTLTATSIFAFRKREYLEVNHENIIMAQRWDHIVFVAAFALITVRVASAIVSSISHKRKARQLGCQATPQVAKSAWWDFGGVLRVRRSVAAFKASRFPDFVLERTESVRRVAGYDAMTYHNHLLGRKVFFTCDPKNIQAILATQFKDFSLPPSRKGSFDQLLGTGIFTSDGRAWEHSRALLRPNFAREQVSNLELENRHNEILARAIPTALDAKGWTSPVDMAKLFFRLTLDTSTEFLFGESVESQLAELPDSARTDIDSSQWKRDTSFGVAFDSAQSFISKLGPLGKWWWLMRSKQYDEDCARCHQFADRYVHRALQQDSKKVSDPESKHQYVFLDELVERTRDPIELRNQLLHVLLAGRDTTAGLLSWLILLLSRHPKVFSELRRNILDDFGSSAENITFAKLKGNTYLQACLNETLRLYPIVPFNTRHAVTDTTLPRGGGSNGESPVFIPKGTDISYSVFVTHREKSLWGEDADEFKPERFIKRKHGFEFLPFNGGPRVCLGQNFAMTSAGYATVRLLQRYDGLNGVDGEETTAESPRQNITLTGRPHGGCVVQWHVPT
ncbi:MAG: hypothetical protein Q9162_005467 [Coniocarpon cinnabarinum]